MPNQRLLQFTNDNGALYPEWEPKALNEVGDFLRGVTYKAEDVEDSGSIVLRATNIQDDKIDMSPNILQFISKTIPPRVQLIDGDIVICRTNGSKRLVGKSGVYRDEYNTKGHIVTVGDFCSILRPASPVASLLLQTFTYKKEIDSLLAGSAINSVKNTDVEKIKFLIPKSIAEQEKIAEFFAVLDERITLTASKVKLLKEQKAGYLQQVFNRELVFTDDNGDAYADWEKIRLKSAIKHESERNKDERLDLILSVSNSKGFVPQKEQFADHRIASASTSNYKIVRKGMFGYNPARINVGSIALLKTFEAGVVSPMYVCFSCEDVLLEEFLEQYFTTNLFRSEMRNKLEGSVRQVMSFDAMAAVVMLLPSVPEQQRIVEFFSALDEQIELIENKLALLKEQKKGYLQGIFG